MRSGVTIETSGGLGEGLGRPGSPKVWRTENRRCQ